MEEASFIYANEELQIYTDAISDLPGWENDWNIKDWWNPIDNAATYYKVYYGVSLEQFNALD